MPEGLFTSMEISSSGLLAQRMKMKMNAIASNIANVNTTKTPDGNPYRRQWVALASTGQAQLLPEEAYPPLSNFLPLVSTNRVHLPRVEFSTSQGRAMGVKVKGIMREEGNFKQVYDPQNPEADEEGWVAMPNIDLVTEMVDMITATRTYEANVTAFNAAKHMALQKPPSWPKPSRLWMPARRQR